MQKSKLVRKGRKGFTLVEVALAVAVGLIIIGGAIVAYNAVKQNASDSAARDKVQGAVAMIENSAGANNGIYPTSAQTNGAFTKMWDAGRQDATANPWGGPTTSASGVAEATPFDFGSGTTTAAATAGDQTAVLTGKLATGASAPGAGDLVYASSTKPDWAQFNDISNNNAPVIVKGYMVGLFDKSGSAVWSPKGAQ